MICFVILHYMAVKETIKTVDCVLKLEGSKQVIVVDNASPNNTIKKLTARYHNNPVVTLLSSKNNVGFAKGNNIGYRYAKQQFDPDFIVVMNSDITVLQNNFINLVKESYQQTNFDIMGPDIITCASHLHQNPLKKSVPTLASLKKARRVLLLKNYLRPAYWIKWKLISRHPAKKKITANSTKTNKVVFDAPLHGSFYVFSKHYLKENSDCFYAKTFMYMEAQILYYLAMKKHYTMIYDPSIEVLHADDASTDLTFEDRYKKAVFSNKALLQSTNAFIELMEKG